MNRGNQNFTAPENWRSRQDHGMFLMGTRNNRSNLQSLSRPFPGAGPLLFFFVQQNPREVLLEPWRLFQERAISGPSFPEQRWYYPDQVTYVDHDAARNAYRTPERSSPEPSSISQGRWIHRHTTEEESKLTQDEQKQALNKLKKEVYFPIPKRGRRPNLYFREHSLNHFAENGKKNDDEDGKRCAICLDDFEAREVVTVTPCKHMFHEDCIIPWVKSQGRCPVCRYAICEKFKENAAPSNNLMENEPYEVELISIIRAMEEAFISENVRRFH